MGLGGIERVRDFICIAQADWEEAVASARVTLDDEKKDVDGNVVEEATKRKLNPNEKAVFGMVQRWARLMVGLDWNEASDGGRRRAAAWATRQWAGTQSMGRTRARTACSSGS